MKQYLDVKTVEGYKKACERPFASSCDLPNMNDTILSGPTPTCSDAPWDRVHDNAIMDSDNVARLYFSLYDNCPDDSKNDTQVFEKAYKISFMIQIAPKI